MTTGGPAAGSDSASGRGGRPAVYPADGESGRLRPLVTLYAPPMPAGLSIRPAVPDDAGPLAALAERSFRDAFAADNAPEHLDAYVRGAFSLARTRAELADPASAFLLAFAGDDAAPAGYAKLRAGPPEPGVRGPDPIELQRLYADGWAVGRGIGAALMGASLAAAREAGYRTVWLGVWERNARALAFYERWGFRPVGSHVFRLGADEQTDLLLERPADERG